MRILFDLTDLVGYIGQHVNYTGIQRVQVDAFRALKIRNDVDVIAVYYSDLARRYCTVNVDRLLDFDKKYAASRQPKFRYRIQNELHRRKQRLLEGVQVRAGDVVFVTGCGWAAPQRTSYINAMASKVGIRIFWMLYDLIPVTRPDFVPAGSEIVFKNWIDGAIVQPATFLCISDYSRHELVRYAISRGCAVDAVTIPLAHEFQEPISSVRSELNLREQAFVLTVGTIEPRKNQISLFRLWQKLYQEIGESLPTLVILGNWGGLDHEMMQILKSGDFGKVPVIHVADGSDSELRWLYENCMFSVFPSIYEGWGLPVGESLWFKKPVICYNLTSIPEVGGRFASYCADESSFEQAVRVALAGKSTFAPPEQENLRTWQMVSDQIASVLKSRS